MRQSFSNQFIDPAALSGIGNLKLVAKHVVEGFITGLHRSPFHGFSLDFAEYREYTPGDDIRSVDWKVFARSDRIYVKKYEGETNCRLHIILDSSKSMDFTSHKLTKLDFARYLAASLAYFALRQKDAAGLLTFDTGIKHHIPPRVRTGHFLKILKQLDHLEAGGKTDVAGVLQKLALLVRKRSIVVIISDFYQEIESLARILRFFHFRGNDIVLFHIMDPMELELPLGETATLEDMETGERIPFEPESSRRQYLNTLQTHVEALKKEANACAIDYELLNTEKPLDKALRRYLSVRSRKY